MHSDDPDGYALFSSYSEPLNRVDAEKYPGEDIARVHNIKRRKLLAKLFTDKDSCTLHSARKTYISSGLANYCPDKSYGFSWVAVHSMDDSVCVVARRAYLAHLGLDTYPKDGVMNAIVSEVEGIPFDRDLYERLGLIININKPFGVVSVCSATGNYGEEEARRDDAIKFLMETVNESVITFDDAIKTAISAFDLLCPCPQELKAEEYSVTAMRGYSCNASPLTVPMIEKHLAGMNKKTADEQLAVTNIGLKKTAKTDERLPVINIGCGISAVTLLFRISHLFYKGKN